MQYGYFNTASGIIQKQSFLMVATIAFIALFQYRKRYGPVATAVVAVLLFKKLNDSFNTASGITQLQLGDGSSMAVSSSRFNTASGITQLQLSC